MQSYRQKENPAAGTVEAVQITKENVSEVAEWCCGKEVDAFDAMHNERIASINLLTVVDGVRRAEEGDYIVKDHIGGFHIRWEDNFERDFEKVGE